MEAVHQAGDFVVVEGAQDFSSFIEQNQRWLAAYRATHDVTGDLGELSLAHDAVLSWLINSVGGSCEQAADALDASDLPYVWLNANFPEGLDPDRMITTLACWLRWLGACGLFATSDAERFAREVEATRAVFVAWAEADVPPSASTAGQDLIAAFTWWARELKERPIEALLACQAALTAALNLLGDVDGDLRTLDTSAWLQRAAHVLFDDPHSPLVRQAVDDVVQWYGVRGLLTVTERKRLHRAIAHAHQRSVGRARLEAMEPTLAQAS